MATEINNIAVFCDFENLARGAQEARYARFDIQKILERLLLKGRIVVKKAYCNWSRYNEFKLAMHEAAFELIDIPPTSKAGKNSADIRLVVEAMDLCYTKGHVDTFVIISGDSDFQPLVNKLKENRKVVIGVGISKSTSPLLVSSCDEFIYYDDLVRAEEQRKAPATAPAAAPAKAPRAKQRKPAGAAVKAPAEDRRHLALDLLMKTLYALVEERGEDAKIWGSALKSTIKRRDPGFDERYFGFRTFSDLLEAAQSRGLLKLERDEKSGGYILHPGSAAAT
jgi:uncharacterized protein (TIGR00288 family)